MAQFQFKAAGEEKKQSAAATEAAQTRAMYRGKVSFNCLIDPEPPDSNVHPIFFPCAAGGRLHDRVRAHQEA
jgi:hypothetical protein